MGKAVWFIVAVCLFVGISGSRLRAESGDEAATEKLAKEKNGTPVYSFWKDDFYLSTPDENFYMRIRGNVHLDTKFYTNDESANPTQFDIRRGRMDFRGVLYDYIHFRVQAELADTPYIRNAWADFELRPWLHVRAGQMKPPFSTSWWTKDNNVNFMERGANTPLYPYFDRGWWVWGELFEGAMVYNLGAFTGAGMDFDYKRGDIDDHKDVVAKLLVAPFLNSGMEPLQGLYLVGEWSSGNQSIPTKRFELKGYGAAVRDDKFWTWETESVGTGEVGRRDRWGAEIHYIYGPFSLSSEYLEARYSDIKVFALDGTEVIDDDGTIASWSTWMSFFLTGESKQVGNFGWKQPKPKKDYDPVNLSGPGAWEVIVRYTRTETDEDLFKPVTYGGDDYVILSGSHHVDEYTAGINWTWNPMVRWQLNYVYLAGDDKYGGIRSGDKENEDGYEYVETEEMIGLRMVFKF